ncbi:MAG: alpha/beta fold hydrolase [Alphaproteobacteria bacterium]
MLLRSEDCRFTVAGRHLAARRLFPAAPAPVDAPTLVFLHEGLGAMTMWRDFPAQLVGRTGLPGLMYDRMGHGLSDPMDGPRRMGYLDREAGAFLPGLLAAAGVARPILVGHSDGGTIALLYAAMHPAAGVVSMAAHVFIDAVSLAGLRTARRAWETGDLKARLARHHGDKTAAMFLAWNDLWLTPRFASWQMLDRLPFIDCPVLAMQGAEDEYGLPSQIEAIRDGVSGPAQALLLPDCAHIPHLQAPAAALDAIAAFVETLR